MKKPYFYSCAYSPSYFKLMIKHGEDHEIKKLAYRAFGHQHCHCGA